MILYNHPSYFKSGEINSCRLSPLPTNSTKVFIEKKYNSLKQLKIVIARGVCMMMRFPVVYFISKVQQS